MSSYGLHHPTRVNYTWATLITPACSQEITLPFWNRLCFARGNSCAPDIKASPTFQEDINQKTKPSKKVFMVTSHVKPVSIISSSIMS